MSLIEMKFVTLSYKYIDVMMNEIVPPPLKGDHSIEKLHAALKKKIV